MGQHARPQRCPLRLDGCTGTFRDRGAKSCFPCSQKIRTTEADERQAIPTGMTYEREWQVWLKEIGAARDRYTGPAKPKARTGRLKVVAAGDFHVPFHDRAALAALIA